MRHLARIFAGVLGVLVVAATCGAQDSVITGKVSDPSSAPLPGVSLTLTSPAVMGVRSVVSDEQGNYRFQFLPPGAYMVKFELSGFRTIIRENVQLTAGFTSTVNVVMDVAPIAETVTVSGESPLIDVTNAI